MLHDNSHNVYHRDFYIGMAHDSPEQLATEVVGVNSWPHRRRSLRDLVATPVIVKARPQSFLGSVDPDFWLHKNQLVHEKKHEKKENVHSSGWWYTQTISNTRSRPNLHQLAIWSEATPWKSSLLGAALPDPRSHSNEIIASCGLTQHASDSPRRSLSNHMLVVQPNTFILTSHWHCITLDLQTVKLCLGTLWVCKHLDGLHILWRPLKFECQLSVHFGNSHSGQKVTTVFLGCLDRSNIEHQLTKSYIHCVRCTTSPNENIQFISIFPKAAPYPLGHRPKWSYELEPAIQILDWGSNSQIISSRRSKHTAINMRLW